MPRKLLLLTAGLIVLAGAACLRLTGLDWLLPSLIEQDAHIPVQVRLMESGSGDEVARLDWGVYPHLVARLTHWFTPREQWDGGSDEIGLSGHLARAAWPVLRVRIVVALLSLLAIPATFLLARRWLPPGWSLLAAALMASSLLALQFGAEARAHGAAVGLFALAVLACAWFRRRGDAGSCAVASLAVALTIACLQSGVATLLPLGLAHLGVARQHGRGRAWLLLIPAACIALAVVAFYPFVFEPSSGTDAARLELEGAVLEQAKHQIFLAKFNGLGFPLMGRALFDWEPALAAGGAFALALWLLARRRPTVLRAERTDRLVVLAFALPYAFVIGLYQRSYERFLLPLVPFLAVFAAWGVARACEPIARPAPRRVVGAVLAGALLGFPTLVAVRLVRARSAPSTLQVAADWVTAHVAVGREAVVTSRSLSLPLFRTRIAEAYDAKVRPDRGLGWSTYQSTVLTTARPTPAYHILWMPFTTLEALQVDLARGPRRWVAKLPADLCVAEVITDPLASGELTVVTAALRDTCESLALISPDGGPSAWDVKLAYQDETTGTIPPMAWRVLHAERFGPVIEIFRVSHEAGSGGAH